MQLGSVINIGLGLAFTFFLLSVIASAIQETLAGICKWRGTYLAKALDVILSNDPNATFGFYGVRDWLTAHFTTSPAMTEAQHQQKLAQMPKLWFRPPPAQTAPIPLTQAEKRLAGLLASIKSHPLIKNVPTSLPTYISGKTFAVVLLSVLRDGSQYSPFAQVDAAIKALPDGDFKTTLSTYFNDSGRDLDKFRASIESWFDGAMDRLTGIYKRISQYALLIIGAILAVVLNVNAVHVASVLWTTDPSSLSALADVAAQAKASGSALDMSDITKNLNQLQSLGLPIGWPHTPNWRGLLSPSYWHDNFLHFIGYHLAGWLVTAAAVSFGAPFWFDLIQKLVNLRSAGPKPDSTTSSTS